MRPTQNTADLSLDAVTGPPVTQSGSPAPATDSVADLNEVIDKTQDELAKLTRRVALTTDDAAGGLHLLDYADEFVALDALYAMDDGEVTEAHEELEAELLTKAAMKTDRYLAVMRLLNARAEFCKAEEARLAARRKTAENRIERMKRYALLALERAGAQKFEGVTGDIRWQWGAPSVVVEVEAEELPDDYIRIVPSRMEPDKRAIGDALKAGKTIPGCTLTRDKIVRWSK